jgi:hypothetical protein
MPPQMKDASCGYLHPSRRTNSAHTHHTQPTHTNMKAWALYSGSHEHTGLARTESRREGRGGRTEGRQHNGSKLMQRTKDYLASATAFVSSCPSCGLNAVGTSQGDTQKLGNNDHSSMDRAL